MNIFLIILLVISCVILFYFVIKHLVTKKDILNRFKNGNVIVSGRKGYGKDLLFQYVINKRKSGYFSNLDYGGCYHNIAVKDLELSPNDYNHFIKGEIKQINKNEEMEGHDIYLSDSGVYLPSQFDSTIQKVYPSLSIFFALNRHLYNNGMHLNAQRLDRIFKSLREQADSYILLRKRRIKIPFFIVIRTRVYEKYDSALQELEPLNSRFFNKYSKAEVDLYKAKHGYIKNGLLFISKRSLHYDSRAFHKILFGYDAPKKQKKDNYIDNNEIIESEVQ